MNRPSSYWKSKRVWGWALYDFANSAFATTILAVVFNVYFVQRIVPAEGLAVGSLTIPGSALWGYTVSFSMLLTFLLAPLLGAIADHTGRKKVFLTFFWLLGSLASAGLFFAQPGDVSLAIFFFVVANISFAGGNVFYNSFLPELGSSKEMGRISGLGWAIGYLGGGLCLALNLLIIRSPEFFGLSAENFLPVRATFLSVGLWWLVFGLPLLFWVREATPASRLLTNPFSTAGKRLLDTYRNIRRYRNLVKYLVAYLLYNDGIETIILMSSIFGAQALGMSPDELVLCFLLIQAVAFVGAYLFGWLADRIQHKKVIFITLAVYVGVLLWAAVMESSREFWILGIVVGLILGGSQAASRSLMALLTPAEKSAEFFSFYGVAGKLTAILGPLLFGFASQLYGLRAGVLSLLIFFVSGGGILLLVQDRVREE